MFIAFKCAVASAALWPPERNTMPGTALGTARFRHLTVASATSSTPACRGQVLPERTMLGLSREPSRTTRWACNWKNTLVSVASVTASQTSSVWLPSIKTSGSTIGTRPASCERAANRASACAFASMQNRVGMPSPIVITARHLVNRAPNLAYSARRSRRPSNPSVIFSPGNPASGFAPVSTLIPGMIPAWVNVSEKRVPSAVAWRMVSSKRMTPLMNSPTPAVVKSISR